MDPGSAAWVFGPAALNQYAGHTWAEVANQAGDLMPLEGVELGGRVTEAPARFTAGIDALLPNLLQADTAWMLSAACASKPEVKFFMTGRGRGTYAAAKGVCEGCSVRSDCLEFALRERIVDGVWGGRSPLEREKLDRPFAAECVVYFAAPRPGLVKIGTTRHLDGRMADLELTLLATEPGSYQQERDLHVRFADYHLHGEMFRHEGELADYIQALAAGYLSFEHQAA